MLRNLKALLLGYDRPDLSRLFFSGKVASQRYSPQEVRAQLEQLIQRASTAEPNLAKKLTDLKKWIKERKDGFLNTKVHILELLTEVILDSEIWLACKSMSSAQKEQFYTSIGASAAEMCWQEEFFPRWFNGYDSKMPRWKNELMKGDSKREDETIIGNTLSEIEASSGSGIWRYLLDLSMATDLLVVGKSEIPICVQLTTITGIHLANKKKTWGETLISWQIIFGLLVSHPPSRSNLHADIGTAILTYSDRLLNPCYTIVEL